MTQDSTSTIERATTRPEIADDPRFGPALSTTPTIISVVLVVFGAWLAFLTYKVYAEDTQPASPASPAASASSPAAPVTGAYSIDRIGDESIEASGKVELSAPSASVAIKGWAVDGKANALAGTVTLLVDGTNIVPLTYGERRPDVADSKGNPALVNSGYSGSIPADLLTTGTHSVALKITPKAGGAPTVTGKVKIVVS